MRWYGRARVCLRLRPCKTGGRMVSRAGACARARARACVCAHVRLHASVSCTDARSRAGSPACASDFARAAVRGRLDVHACVGYAFSPPRFFGASIGRGAPDSHAQGLAIHPQLHKRCPCAYPLQPPALFLPAAWALEDVGLGEAVPRLQPLARPPWLRGGHTHLLQQFRHLRHALAALGREAQVREVALGPRWWWPRRCGNQRRAWRTRRQTGNSVREPTQPHTARQAPPTAR